MKKENTTSTFIVKSLIKLLHKLRTFNPLAAGSIPARPTKIKHLRARTKKATSTNIHIMVGVFVFLGLFGAPPAQAKGWDFYFFGINAKTFKEADWRMVALGAVTSAVVHVGGHYAYAGIHGMSVRQDGFIEVISLDEHNPQRIREFMQAGFVLQHAVGVALTTIPATRQTDFTRGYVAYAWGQTVIYPLFMHREGDLHWSNHYGGNSDLEYAVYLAAATHNVLRVNWKKE